MVGLVLGLHSVTFAQMTVLGKEYRIEAIEGEPGSYRVVWGNEEMKWEPKPWYDLELKAKGPFLYIEWLQPLYYPYTIPLEEREKFDAFDVQNTATFLGPSSALDFESKVEAGLYAPETAYRRDKSFLVWEKWYTIALNGKWRWDPSPPPELKGRPYKKSLIVGRSPRDLLKLGFLQIQYQGNKEDDNFLYLPQQRKIRRLPTFHKQDVLLGLIVREEQYSLMKPVHNYKMLRTELLNPPPDAWSFWGEGELRRNPWYNYPHLDGSGEPCWVYEVTPSYQNWWFAKQIYWVGIFSLINWYTESYDQAGRLIQVLRWPQILVPPGKASRDEVPNCCGRQAHLASGPALFKDPTTGFWVVAFPTLITLNPPIPDDFFNVQTLIKEPKTLDFYR